MKALHYILYTAACLIMLMHNLTPHLHAEEAEVLNLPQKELSFPDFLSVLGDDLGREHLEHLLVEDFERLSSEEQLEAIAFIPTTSPIFSFSLNLDTAEKLALFGFDEKCKLVRLCHNLCGRAPPSFV